MILTQTKFNSSFCQWRRNPEVRLLWRKKTLAGGITIDAIKMDGSARQNKKMEKFVKSHGLARVRFFDCVNNRADGVENSAEQQQRNGRGMFSERIDQYRADPAHQQIKAGGRAARKGFPKRREKDRGGADAGQNPNRRKKSGAPKSAREYQAKWREGSGNENIDESVVQLADQTDLPAARSEQMIPSAGSIEQKRRNAENEKCRHLARAVRLLRQRDCSGKSQNRPDQMGIAAYRILDCYVHTLNVEQNPLLASRQNRSNHI